MPPPWLTLSLQTPEDPARTLPQLAAHKKSTTPSWFSDVPPELRGMGQKALAMSCLEYMQTKGCDWTQEWACRDSGTSGTQGYAHEDGSLGYK